MQHAVPPAFGRGGGSLRAFRRAGYADWINRVLCYMGWSGGSGKEGLEGIKTLGCCFPLAPVIRNQNSSKSRLPLVGEGAKGLLGIKKVNLGISKIPCHRRCDRLA